MKQVYPSEEFEQRELFRLLKVLTQVWPKFNLIIHIPNGGAGPLRGMAGRMKAMGTKAGVSDIFYPVARQGYHGCWIELKSRKPSARLSDDQRLWLVAMRYEGYYSIFCNGYKEALQAIIFYETGIDLSMTDIDYLPQMLFIKGKNSIQDLIKRHQVMQKCENLSA